MSRIPLMIVMIFCYAVSARSQEGKIIRTNFIDSIETAQQIEDLITQINPSFKHIKVNSELKFSDDECQKHSDSLKLLPWTKADFDNNGLTDILIVGRENSIICILDKGSKRYSIIPFNRQLFQGCAFPIVKTNGSKTIINFYETHKELRRVNEPKVLNQIVLVYSFDDFVEFNSQPVPHKIEKLEFETSGCYGSCPIFKLTLKNDRSASWIAERFNVIDGKEIIGEYSAMISEEEFSELVKLVNYIDFEKLQSSYQVPWTDDQTGTLKITYNNGMTKTIRDYGLVGTFGLNRLYQILFGLREHQMWKKTN